MYCIDTSSLIDMQDIYPIDTFPGVWEQMESIAETGELVSPREVFRELEKRTDELCGWAKRNISFRDLNSSQEAVVKDIMAQYGAKFVDISKLTPEADPFVIALAKSESRTVITQEKHANLSGPQTKYKMPNVCDDYDVECIPILRFFQLKKWQFKS